MRYVLGVSLALALSLLAMNARSADRTVRIGFVDPVSLSPSVSRDAFWARLRELGWVEGRNLVIETRSAEGHYDRLSAIMTDLAAREVDVIVTYSTVAGLAAKKATTTVPI